LDSWIGEGREEVAQSEAAASIDDMEEGQCTVWQCQAAALQHDDDDAESERESRGTIS
jgi:hypothetical protein